MLCVFVFYLQVDNYDEVFQSASDYCSSVKKEEAGSKYDILKLDLDYCPEILVVIHEQGFDRLIDLIKDELVVAGFEGLYLSDLDKITALLQKDYTSFQIDTVDSIDGALMHFPIEWWNIWSMITSSFAHADIFHILFNLIFFLAFAPALEILVDNKLRFSFIILGLCFATGISYSLSVLVSGGNNVPTLGLSGVVMGMIGLSAFMMPRARIRCFLWFIALVRTYYIPAWILAAWYIGWDTWNLFSSEDTGGVNLMSHVSGGFAGYLIGYLWFKDQRGNVQDELEDEIEYMRAERAFGATHLNYSGGQRELENRYRVKQAKCDDDAFMAQVYQYVNADRDSDAIVLMLNDYEFQKSSVQIFEELFDRVKEWGDTRALLCLGRTVINLLVEQRKYARSLVYIEQCQRVVKGFVLADPGHVLLIASIAKDNRQYEIAYHLVADSNERYGNYINAEECEQLISELPEI